MVLGAKKNTKPAVLSQSANLPASIFLRKENYGMFFLEMTWFKRVHIHNLAQIIKKIYCKMRFPFRNKALKTP